MVLLLAQYRSAGLREVIVQVQIIAESEDLP